MNRSRRRVRALLFLALPAVLAAAPPSHAGPSFVNFETQQGQPISISTDGRLIYAVNTPDARLSVLDAASLSLLAEIPVGLEPVSVLQRPGSDEIWVVNGLSDSVSIVTAAGGHALATVPVGDAPVAIAFTPDGTKAYVTSSGRNRVDVLDAASRSPIGSVPIPARNPGALSMSPDGRLLYVAVLDSGNGTRTEPPRRGSPSSRIVFDPNLPDRDVFAIRTGDDTIAAVAGQLGTLITAVRVDPSGTTVYAANTEANNLVAGEENLRGVAIDNRLAILDAASLSPRRLVPLDTAGGGPSSSAAHPTDVAFNRDGSKVYVAAFGGGVVEVLDAAGERAGRIRVGRGPRGLAFNRTDDRLYILDRIDQTVTAIDTLTDTIQAVAPLGYDPTPALIREGRRVLYNARLSGTGKFSCAGCHAGAHFDNLVWDLGTAADPKGPMFTQSLRGLRGLSPYHWRGERPDLMSFNPAFESLMGGRRLPESRMRLFSDFLETIVYPPNPDQAPDRSLTGAARRGSETFHEPGKAGTSSCVSCHTLQTPSGAPAFGTNRRVLPGPRGTTMKVPQLRGIIGKSGYEHDALSRNLLEFLSLPVFNLTPPEKHDLIAFLTQFETETMPAVGLQAALDAASCEDPAVLARIELLMARASAVTGPGQREIQLEARGRLPQAYGPPRVASLLFRPDLVPPAYETDLTGDGPYAFEDLRLLACGAGAMLTFTGIPDGTGVRTLDRDEDGLPDGDESVLHGTDPARADTDGDGLRDGIEILSSGTDPLKADTDGDGVSDRAELDDGTDPHDSLSFVRLVGIEKGPADGEATLTWTTEAGARYRVESADLPASGHPGTGETLPWVLRYVSGEPEDESPTGTESWTDPAGPAPGTVRLYRVRVA